MKKLILFSAIALAAGSLVAADAKDDVLAAAKKLSGAGNYSWKMTMDMGANSPFQPGPTEGKIDKDGTTWVSSSFGDNTSEGIVKGTNVAIKAEDGWKSGSELTGGGGGGFNFSGFMVRRLQTLKAPSAEVEDLVSKAKSINKDGDTYNGDLTEEGAKALAAFGGRRGGQGGQGGPPQPTGVKGSMKFWIKDGTLTKYETKITGKRQDQDGNEVEFERNTTTELKDVGTTKLNVPDEAKKKLS